MTSNKLRSIVEECCELLKADGENTKKTVRKMLEGILEDIGEPCVVPNGADINERIDEAFERDI